MFHEHKHNYTHSHFSQFCECALKRVSNTLMRRTLLWFRSIYSTWVADGTHQTSIWSALTFRHLFGRGTKTCIPAQKNSASSFCSQQVTLAQRRRLLQIACEPGASERIHRDGNHCSVQRQPDLWLVVGGYGPICLQSQTRGQWFPFPLIP
jgi:hypothetical protein